jgi:soluble lytic murein transglycosylase-like protein
MQRPAMQMSDRCFEATRLARRPRTLPAVFLGLVALACAAGRALPTASEDAVSAAHAAAPAQMLPAHVAAAPDATVDAVAAAIARKYRVSELGVRDFVRTAYREASVTGLDPLLIVAVMAVESRFNPVAQSEGGAMGLMQVIPRYHAAKFPVHEAGIERAVLDPRTNIAVGARVLKEAIVRGGNETAGLQLYNGASGDTSSAYAGRVLAERQWLKEALKRSRDRLRA